VGLEHIQELEKSQLDEDGFPKVSSDQFERLKDAMRKAEKREAGYRSMAKKFRCEDVEWSLTADVLLEIDRKRRKKQQMGSDDFGSGHALKKRPPLTDLTGAQYIKSCWRQRNYQTAAGMNAYLVLKLKPLLSSRAVGI
jgi:hypothetical protein